MISAAAAVSSLVRVRRWYMLARGLLEQADARAARLVGRRDYNADYFDRIYAQPDPWGYSTSPYEATRRSVLLAAVPSP